MAVKETGSQAKRRDGKDDQPNEREDKRGAEAAVPGTKHPGPAAGPRRSEPDTIGSTIPTKRADGSTRHGSENEGEPGREEMDDGRGGR